MKRVMILLVMVYAIVVSAFAQTYTVHSITGRVERESGSARVELKVGELINSETIIITGIGASLVLQDGERSFTISGARNGKAGELAAASSVLRISGTVITTDTSEVSRTAAQTSTASARSSDAAADDDIAAE